MIPFDGPANAMKICMNDGYLTFEESGAYMVSLGVTIPANVYLTTDLSILLNGEAVPGGTLPINKTDTDAPLRAGVQTVVSVCAGAVLSVSTSEPINLEAGNDSAPVFTLTAVKIS